uniref:Putative secreted protein n=1 Tax=Ixodes ricinus TaxID=34613 RepID=A0A6B0UGI2_IXORI
MLQYSYFFAFLPWTCMYCLVSGSGRRWRHRRAPDPRSSLLRWRSVWRPYPQCMERSVTEVGVATSRDEHFLTNGKPSEWSPPLISVQTTLVAMAFPWQRDCVHRK